VRLRVVDQLLEHAAYPVPVSGQARLLEGIDVRNDPAVLRVDDLDSGIERIAPLDGHFGLLFAQRRDCSCRRYYEVRRAVSLEKDWGAAERERFSVNIPAKQTRRETMAAAGTPASAPAWTAEGCLDDSAGDLRLCGGVRMIRPLDVDAVRA
jgi:hypothetical protein